tara:strand:+ start:450 stop:791 length:342 start_codon:yes stop_codon:yes gene_type:complete
MTLLYDKDGNFVAPSTSTLSLHEVKEIRLSSYWATHQNNKPMNSVYCVNKIKFEGGSADHEIITFESNGVIIEDSDEFTIDYVVDEETAKKTMFIHRKPPVLVKGQTIKGANE